MRQAYNFQFVLQEAGPLHCTWKLFPKGRIYDTKLVAIGAWYVDNWRVCNFLRHTESRRYTVLLLLPSTNHQSWENSRGKKNGRWGSELFPTRRSGLKKRFRPMIISFLRKQREIKTVMWRKRELSCKRVHGRAHHCLLLPLRSPLTWDSMRKGYALEPNNL